MTIKNFEFHIPAKSHNDFYVAITWEDKERCERRLHCGLLIQEAERLASLERDPLGNDLLLMVQHKLKEMLAPLTISDPVS